VAAPARSARESLRLRYPAAVAHTQYRHCGRAHARADEAVAPE